MPPEINYLTDLPGPNPVTGAVDGEYSQNTQHAEETYYNLIDFFKKPRNKAVIDAVAEQIQELEDALWGLGQAFNLDTATGHQLELLGKLVGEYRQDRSDGDYRAAVRSRILINSSEGTRDDLYAVAKSISPTAIVRTLDVYPATFYVETDISTPTTPERMFSLLKQAKTAGVRLLFGYAGTPGAIGSVAGPDGGIVGDTDNDPLGFEISGGF